MFTPLPKILYLTVKCSDSDLQQGLNYVNKERKIKLCVFKWLEKNEYPF